MKSSQSVPRDEASNRLVDASLSALLGVQVLTLFVAIPIGASFRIGLLLLDLCHLTFAAVCVAVLVRMRSVQIVLLLGLGLLATAPIAGSRLTTLFGIQSATVHDLIAGVAFAFNLLVTGIVARHVFAQGRVTMHRIRGAILLYLNVAALFASAYGLLLQYEPDSITQITRGPLILNAGSHIAEMTYFSLSTITTAGFGDFVPIDWMARSLANLEAVIGQLFPATLLARLVALQLAHRQPVKDETLIDP